MVESYALPSLSSLVDRLRRKTDPTLDESVCEAMSTGETSFFRNPSAFERLRLTVIPQLIEARADERRLWIWSAGCSTGQEVYSISLLLLEHFPETRTWDIQILGTDSSRATIRRAEVGDFSVQEMARGLPDAWRRDYFSERDGRWSIAPEARRLVRFQALNLLGPPPGPDKFDLILIRNVLIYFAIEKRACVFAMLRRAIRDDGFLFLGESETILGQKSGFEFVDDAMDYYRPAPSPSI